MDRRSSATVVGNGEYVIVITVAHEPFSCHMASMMHHTCRTSLMYCSS